jgi:hypothetical protein
VPYETDGMRRSVRGDTPRLVRRHRLRGTRYLVVGKVVAGEERVVVVGV